VLGKDDDDWADADFLHLLAAHEMPMPMPMTREAEPKPKPKVRKKRPQTVMTNNHDRLQVMGSRELSIANDTWKPECKNPFPTIVSPPVMNKSTGK
jgi:hypothetical protein